MTFAIDFISDPYVKNISLLPETYEKPVGTGFFMSILEAGHSD